MSSATTYRDRAGVHDEQALMGAWVEDEETMRAPSPAAGSRRTSAVSVQRPREMAADALLERVRRVLEAIVDHHVAELVLRARAPRARSSAGRRPARASSVPRPTSRARSASSRRRRDEDLDGLGHRLADLARALDLDLEHDRVAAGEPRLELGPQRPVATARVARVLDELALLARAARTRRRTGSGSRPRAPRPAAAGAWWPRRRARAPPRARAGCGSACPCRPRTGR